MTVKLCEYPRCEQDALDQTYCRRHRDRANRLKVWQREARNDKSQAQDWETLSFIGIFGMPVCRMVISRDPVRRRDELQAGCPWTLKINAVVLAPRSTLEVMSSRTERLLMDAGLRTRLRPGWWASTSKEVEHVAMQVCDVMEKKGIRRPVSPAAIRRRDLDLTDPAQDRLNDLLNQLAQEIDRAQ